MSKLLFDILSGAAGDKAVFKKPNMLLISERKVR